jgi:DNA-binding IclR family transcriptional regulator
VSNRKNSVATRERKRLPVEKPYIQALDRALEVLLLFQQEKRELGVTEIAAKLGYYKSTVYRVLATLERRGFVQQNELTGKYWLGLRVYALGLLCNRLMGLRDMVKPWLRELGEKYQETVHLAVLNDNREKGAEIIVIDKVETNHSLSLTPPFGSSSPAHCSGVGKVLLAYSDRGWVYRVLGQASLVRFTDNTITDWGELEKELDRIRRAGYALDNEEIEVGLRCVAAPIFGPSGTVVAALSISGPTSRLTDQRLPELIAGVMETARAISNRLE